MKVSVYLLIGLLSGCIMPIPHKRVSVIGIEGIVCDSDTGAPILGASVSVMYSGKSKIVFTDEQGRYKVEEEKRRLMEFHLHNGLTKVKEEYVWKPIEE